MVGSLLRLADRDLLHSLFPVSVLCNRPVYKYRDMMK